MRDLRLEPLTQAAFAPFGEVLTPPAPGGRDYFDRALANGRPGAWPSLSIAHVDRAATLPLAAHRLERHPASSQSFVPLDAVGYLVVVAPARADGGPDIDGLRAFEAAAGQGVTYAMDVWHHPLTVFAAPARFAIWMWRDGTTGDDEFVDMPAVRFVAG
jgi:ureidoglycolate lyase